MGHIVIDCRDDARRDNAGKSGSLEAYAAKDGVVGRTRDALDAGGKSGLSARLADGEELTPLVIAQEAEQGDALAHQVVMDTACYLAIGIVSLVHTIDPDSVVLGGAMTFGAGQSPLGRKFLQRIREEFDRRVLGSLRGKVQMDFATLGGDAG